MLRTVVHMNAFDMHAIENHLLIHAQMSEFTFPSVSIVQLYNFIKSKKIMHYDVLY